ncbi:MAG: sigma 54-interacting transcriptional regulator [Gemmatimonadaceae bacterium]|nr:sigma 54-interacting transcriptional regulator [Gemmatimonadaceae bacterium]
MQRSLAPHPGTFPSSTGPRLFDPAALDQLELAHRIGRLSVERWGERRAVTIVGRHQVLESALEQLAAYARVNAPVLLSGETGTGKELFARALYLFSARRQRPYVAVNCAQFADSQLTVSQLFGHKRGSFTGAVADQRGIFEEADGGVVFLDEVGELSAHSQSMLLRVLSEGEIVPIGTAVARPVDVRIIAATSRELEPMVAAGTFRADLYFRLRYLQLHVPPVRERGDDWSLIAERHLALLGASGDSKRLAPEAHALLSRYPWPGNVREIKSVIDTGFCLSEGDVIVARDFSAAMERISQLDQLARIPVRSEVPAAPERTAEALLARMTSQAESFWDVIHRPYIERELNRGEVRAVIACGLANARGSYKRMLAGFGLGENDYLKVMDFLRHQNLKPNAG